MVSSLRVVTPGSIQRATSPSVRDTRSVAARMVSTQMAEDMKRNNGFIPGVKPGKKTAEYLDGFLFPRAF